MNVYAKIKDKQHDRPLNVWNSHLTQNVVALHTAGLVSKDEARLLHGMPKESFTGIVDQEKSPKKADV